MLKYDLSTIEPQVACPHTVDNVNPVGEVEGKPFHQALIGTCTNGRLEDIEVAAALLKGKKVHTGVRALVLPLLGRYTVCRPTDPRGHRPSRSPT